MADQPAPTPAYDVEAGIASMAFPPPLVKPERSPSKSFKMEASEAPRGPRPLSRLPLREVVNHYLGILPSCMMAEATY